VRSHCSRCTYTRGGIKRAAAAPPSGSPHQDTAAASRPLCAFASGSAQWRSLRMYAALARGQCSECCCSRCTHTCLAIGIHRAGRRRFPDGYGLRTGTDGPERLRRPSRPPDFQGGPNAHEGGSCHVRHHPLMGTADVNRRGSV
jgi:hypothetical protein